MIRVLIVDDEPLARERLRMLCEDTPDLVVVGECGDGRAAAHAILRERPDLMFLDVQMPEQDGFQLLDELGERPLVIFVTAHDRYAVRAFDVQAVDYLLKPFDRARFRAALERAREELRTVGPRPARFALKVDGSVLLLPVADIEWIEAAGNYVSVYAGGKSHIARQTLSELETQLPRGAFLRVHRSAVVNLSRIREVKPSAHGDLVLVLDGGAEVPVGRSHRAELARAIRQPL